MSNEFDTLRPHATKVVSVGDQQAEIDVELAPLIEQMWRVGISTMMILALLGSSSTLLKI